MNVALLDYGVGNLHSLGKALERAGARVRVTRDPQEALQADALVLPGVGAFQGAAGAFDGARDALRDALAGGLPCLGICLGMQLLFASSDEGPGQGIGLVPGRVVRLRADVVPQMGWNDVAPVVRDGRTDPLFAGLGSEESPPVFAAYYANSFVCAPDEAGDVIGWTEYGGTRFVAAVRRANTWGVQFHPEKSSADGLRLVANFVAAATRIRAEGA